MPVTIEEPELCARYAAAVADIHDRPLTGLDAGAISIACGVRPISNIVDITNYVLLELGQPMHAFDLDRLAGPEIRVRTGAIGRNPDDLDGKTAHADQPKRS